VRRHEISDEDWTKIKDSLPGKAGDPGRSAKDNRLFVNAVVWIARTGAPWRDLPERFGHWNSVFQRFNRWSERGVWERLFKAWKDPDLERLMLDSTIVRAHQHAAGAKKKGATKRSADRAVDSAPNCTSRRTPTGDPWKLLRPEGKSTTSIRARGCWPTTSRDMSSRTRPTTATRSLARSSAAAAPRSYLRAPGATSSDACCGGNTGKGTKRSVW